MGKSVTRTLEAVQQAPHLKHSMVIKVAQNSSIWYKASC